MKVCLGLSSTKGSDMISIFLVMSADFSAGANVNTDAIYAEQAPAA
jgi:hypothetical protein